MSKLWVLVAAGVGFAGLVQADALDNMVDPGLLGRMQVSKTEQNGATAMGSMAAVYKFCGMTAEYDALHKTGITSAINLAGNALLPKENEENAKVIRTLKMAHFVGMMQGAEEGVFMIYKTMPPPPEEKVKMCAGAKAQAPEIKGVQVK